MEMELVAADNYMPMLLCTNYFLRDQGYKCSDTISETFWVDETPVVSFTNSNPCVGESASFVETDQEDSAQSSGSSSGNLVISEDTAAENDDLHSPIPHLHHCCPVESASCFVQAPYGRYHTQIGPLHHHLIDQNLTSGDLLSASLRWEG